MYIIYVLSCTGNTLYTGITTNLARRLRQHCGLLSGGAKYTRSHPPERLCCAWEAPDKSTALQWEAKIKALTRAQKEQLIHNAASWQKICPSCADLALTPIQVQSLEFYLHP